MRTPMLHFLPFLLRLGFFGGLAALAVQPLRAADPVERWVVESPLPHQVFQRTNRDSGVVRVVCRRKETHPFEGSVRARMVQLGAPGPWHALKSLPQNPGVYGEDLICPSGGWYRFEVETLDGEMVLARDVVEPVGVGEVFVVAGQSNSANHGEEKLRVETGLVSAWTGTGWQPAHDPQPGASGSAGSFVPWFADEIVRRFDVPVGIIAVGVGATSVREWLPAGMVFTNPPTLTGNVRQLPSGEWESNGRLFDRLAQRLGGPGVRGFRAILWHQGESDANQNDASRTLAGTHYQRMLGHLIRSLEDRLGWAPPWFIARASYHTPNDTGSEDLRAAQKALWDSGLGLEGPDTDSLVGRFRDGGGQGVHFSGAGQREHGRLWVGKLSPWLDEELATTEAQARIPRSPVTGATPRLVLPGMEQFRVMDRPAFVMLPVPNRRSQPQPWIFYAPTLPGYPDGAERWMHENFLAAGVAVAGVDVGEAYGSPQAIPVFEALRTELVQRRNFGSRPCLFGRSRGGLWVTSWATAHPEHVAGIIGIYPVVDFQTYPGLGRAAPAYGLEEAELSAKLGSLNPVRQLRRLAQARIPAVLIHGDVDTVVPLPPNSGEWLRHYREAGAESMIRLITLKGQGHNFYEGFFHSRELVDFTTARARWGAKAE